MVAAAAAATTMIDDDDDDNDDDDDEARWNLPQLTLGLEGVRGGGNGVA